MRKAHFFGSFNPLHKGHLAILRFVCENCDADKVSLVVSPQNPLKGENEASAYARLEAAKEVIAKSGLDVEVSDVEFHLERPLYTINTLRYLRREEPEYDHILIMGGDNLAIIENWYQWRELIDEFEIWVYPRIGSDAEELCRKYNSISNLKKIYLLDAELHNISSTAIREGLKAGKDVSMWTL